MSPEQKSELEAFLSALRVRPPFEYSFCEEIFRTTSDPLGRSLHQALTDLIYRELYSRRFQGRPHAQNQTTSDVVDTSAAFGLTLSNSLTNFTGQITQHNNFIPRFFCIFSIQQPIDPTWKNTRRVYLNCNAETAPEIIPEIVDGLSKRRIAFFLKCPNTPADFDRRDTIVLMFEKQSKAIALDIVKAIAVEFPDRPDDIPLFTKHVSLGAGYAEAPANGESFGGQRSRILASALIAAANDGVSMVADVITAIQNEFKSAGLDVDNPHLEPCA